ncbi:MAG: pyrrolo-quinoline quinone, partial [Planctomycetaceae bacterium]
TRDKLSGTERLVCLDATSGKELWKIETPVDYNISYACGPRVTPTVAAGKVYSLGAEGDLLCAQASTGEIVWRKALKTEYKTEAPWWGFCGHPLIDGQKLICLVGGEGSIAVAFDKDTGEELWRSLSASDPGYCPPSIIEAAGKRQLIIWHADSLNGLDPETGAVYWSHPLAPAYKMSITIPQKSGDYLFASGIGKIGAVVKLAADKPGVSQVWKGTPTTGVYCANSTPLIDGDVIYGCDCDTGHLRAVDLKTGKRLWESLKPTTNSRPAGHATAFLVRNGDRWVLFNESGELIFAKLSAQGYEEISRAKVIEPTGEVFGRTAVWSHPAFANKCAFVRNDKEIVCVSLAQE